MPYLSCQQLSFWLRTAGAFWRAVLEWSLEAEAKHQLVDKEEKRMVSMAPSTAEISNSRQEGLEILAFKTSPIQ